MKLNIQYEQQPVSTMKISREVLEEWMDGVVFVVVFYLISKGTGSFFFFSSQDP